MMTASLTLTGSVVALTAALAAFEAAQEGNPLPVVTPMASTDTGIGIPAPMPLPSVPNTAAPMPLAPIPSMSPVSTTTPSGADDEDEDGEASDGTGVDAEGLPWDERIHSSSKKKTAKGLWAARKGGPKGSDLAAIKSQLRGAQIAPPITDQTITEAAQMFAPAPASPPPVPVPLAASTAPVPMPVAPMPLPVPMPIVAAPEPQPVVEQPTHVPMPVAGAPATEEWDFAKLMAQIGPKMGTTITPDYLAQVCQHYGIGAITDTAAKPEMIAQLVAQFQADGRW